MLIALAVASMALIVNAHPGRTDGKGGHTNHSTGEYHYHHGQPAHDHYDINGDGIIDCPYDFNDKTERNTSTKSMKVETKKDNKILIGILAVGLYFFLMFVLPFLLS